MTECYPRKEIPNGLYTMSGSAKHLIFCHICQIVDSERAEKLSTYTREAAEQSRTQRFSSRVQIFPLLRIPEKELFILNQNMLLVDFQNRTVLVLSL